MAQLFDIGRAAEQPVAFAHVALEQGIDAAPAGLTYGVPAALADLAVGERVRVPLGRRDRPVAGYVVELSATADLAQQRPGMRVKLVIDRDRHHVSLPVDLVDLARWIASYYCCPLGLVFATMLPAAVKRGTGTVTQTLVGLPEAEGKSAPALEPPSHQGEAAAPDAVDASSNPKSEIRNPKSKLTPLQQAVLAAARVRAAEGHAWTPIKDLADLAEARSVSSVKQLIAKGLLCMKHAETVVSDLDLRAQQAAEAIAPLTLSRAQQQALEHLTAHLHDGFGVHLLHGVTGSGKTEVYLRLIAAAFAAAEFQVSSPKSQVEEAGAPADLSFPPGVIVLVPEIALTPQTVARFVRRFGDVAVLHSGLTASQRHVQWRRIRSGEARIVIGARSAVFAPLPNLRLIIVDEEHEHSYKQDQAPRYHGRDVAIKRGQLLGIPVVLGSATPSLESYYNAVGQEVPSSEFRVPSSPDGADSENSEPETRNSKPRRSRAAFHLIRMPDRAPGMKLPHVEIVDLQEERRQRRGIHLLSQRLEAELHRVLETHNPAPGTRNSELSSPPGGRALLLLNRRGYANYIACPDHRCGWMMRCDHCDVTMVYHKDQRLPAGGLVRCHHCDAALLLPATCPTCAKRVTVFGLGTQRVEEEMQRKFPDARILRMDGDTMRSGRDYQQSLDRFRRGEVDVLLGTQMIAKGLDFPSVRLVGVISGDTALHMPDFRAAERTFQLIAQVAGRAGRSDQPGRVIVQSFNPDDPAIQSAAAHDYEGFAARELAFRAEVGLPPITRMARIVIRDTDHFACAQRARQLADVLHERNAELGTEIRLRGPMPCPIARIADFHRQQIELIAGLPQPAARLQRLLTALRNARQLTSDAQTAIDVDPVSLL